MRPVRERVLKNDVEIRVFIKRTFSIAEGQSRSPDKIKRRTRYQELESGRRRKTIGAAHYAA